MHEEKSTSQHSSHDDYAADSPCRETVEHMWEGKVGGKTEVPLHLQRWVKQHEEASHYGSNLYYQNNVFN